MRVESDRIGNLERGNLALCSLSIAPLDRDIQDSSDFRHPESFSLAFDNFGQDHRFLLSPRERHGLETISPNGNPVKFSEKSVVSKNEKATEVTPPALVVVPRRIGSKEAGMDRFRETEVMQRR